VGLVKIRPEQDVEADLSSRLAIEVRRQNDRLVAVGSRRGFSEMDSGPDMVTFQCSLTLTRGRLPSGVRRVVGCLRFNEEIEVSGEIKKL
jgi:hypothetical protein